MPVTQDLSDYGVPEQLQGKPDVDSRADTFAFGCVLRNADRQGARSKAAFEGKDAASVIAAINRRTAASLNSFVKILLDNPMTEFSFGWILSLNWLCQKWGQVQSPI